MQTLEVKDLQISFNDVIAVNNISFHLTKGETVGIVGESGSGKTATALSILRLLSPDALLKGEIKYTQPDGNPVNLSSLSLNEMRNYRGKHIAMIFQEPMTSLNPVLTCGRQVAEALLTHKKVNRLEAREMSIALFEKAKLPKPEQVFDLYPHQLSGGQKQRVMIAMAISCNPEILIADEPTTALDVTVQSTILSLLDSLRKENNMGMLFISHDLGVVAEIADRVLVMYKGRIVEEGSVIDIFSNPQHPYTKGLIACRPPLNKRVRILPTIHDFMKEEQGKMVEIIPAIDQKENVVPEHEIFESRKIIYASPPVLQVKNIKVQFPVSKGVFGKTIEFINAVDDVSFDVYQGETLGLVGESGSGKTTLGRTIICLTEPSEGKILFKGKDLLTLNRKEIREMRKNIQIIFQDPYSSLNPRMKAGDAILEPLEVHNLHSGKRKERVYELLEMVHLSPDHFNRFPHELSSGQRQRVYIARALSIEPEFLICDECVSALDVSVQAQILNLLNKLKRELNFTCIFISHDLSVVKFMSDRMIVLNKGKIEETGEPETLYKSPLSNYTKKLIDAIPLKNQVFVNLQE